MYFVLLTKEVRGGRVWFLTDLALFWGIYTRFAYTGTYYLQKKRKPTVFTPSVFLIQVIFQIIL